MINMPICRAFVPTSKALKLLVCDKSLSYFPSESAVLFKLNLKIEPEKSTQKVLLVNSSTVLKSYRGEGKDPDTDRSSVLNLFSTDQQSVQKQ